MIFSKKYKLYSQWLKAEARNTEYGKRIINAHKRYPFASLSQLRNISTLDLSKLKLSQMTEIQKQQRRAALDVKNSMSNRKLSLTEAAKDRGISLRLVKRHLGRILFRKNERWFVRKDDWIERNIRIIEKGKGYVDILINDSKQASIVGRYDNAVKKAVNRYYSDERDFKDLKKFDGVFVLDSDGNKYYLETDPRKILHYKEMVEEPEFEQGVYAE
ncbi:MAG: hypothetical protein KC550_06375 [Nanoarchaeota archaeon]|nr:hypothetical protein [Nanoarchaeota archaeon]